MNQAGFMFKACRHEKSYRQDGEFTGERNPQTKQKMMTNVGTCPNLEVRVIQNSVVFEFHAMSVLHSLNTTSCVHAIHSYIHEQECNSILPDAKTLCKHIKTQGGHWQRHENRSREILFS